MKNTFIIILLALFPIVMLAQEKGGISSNYQLDYSKINKILKKDVSSITKSDINTLKRFSNYPDNHYGEINSVNFRALKNRISRKLTEFSGHSDLKNKYSSVSKAKEQLGKQLLDSAAVIQSLRDTLNQVRNRLYRLIRENKELKSSIDSYKKKVAHLESVIKGLNENWDFLDQIVTNLSFIDTYRSEFDGPDIKNLYDSTRSVINKSSLALLELMDKSLDYMHESENFIDSASTYYKDSALHLPDLHLFGDKINDFESILDSSKISSSSKFDNIVEDKFSSIKSKYDSLLSEIEVNAKSNDTGIFTSIFNSIGSFFANLFADGLFILLIFAILLILLILFLILINRKHLYYLYILYEDIDSKSNVIEKDSGLKASKLSVPESGDSKFIEIVYPKLSNNIFRKVSGKDLFLKVIIKENIEVISFSDNMTERKKEFHVNSGETSEILFNDIENNRFKLQLEVYEENNELNDN